MNNASEPKRSYMSFSFGPLRIEAENWGIPGVLIIFLGVGAAVFAGLFPL